MQLNGNSATLICTLHVFIELCSTAFTFLVCLNSHYNETSDLKIEMICCQKKNKNKNNDVCDIPNQMKTLFAET